MFARILYFSRSSLYQLRNVGVSSAMPLPTMATSRPPSCKRRSACSMCGMAFLVEFFVLPPVDENGGFISTTDGETESGRMLLICSAFSLKNPSKGSCFSISKRLSDSSFTYTVAPSAFAKDARPPIPADGSSTVSLLSMLATQDAR